MLNHQWIKVLEISYDKNSSISNAQIVGIGEVDGIKHEKNIKTTEIVQVK